METQIKPDKRLSDKEFRISHFYKIKTKNQTFVTFKRNRAQQDFHKNKHTRNIILKSRQLGFTTDEAMDTLDDVAFNRNFDACFSIFFSVFDSFLFHMHSLPQNL